MVRKPRQMRLTPAHVALLPAKVDDPGPLPADTAWEQDARFTTVEVKARNLLASVPPGGEVWVFALGSLIWKKRFDFVEERRGVARGWHRSFCLGPDTRFRGNPEAPGYMLSLDRGGQCGGMVYRLPPDAVDANVDRLLRNEPPYPPVWITVSTAAGPVRAFTFAAPRYFPPFYVGRLSDDAVADALARAVGMVGSMAEYLYLTVRNLEDLGLCDTRLWCMQEMVAERIEQIHGVPAIALLDRPHREV